MCSNVPFMRAFDLRVAFLVNGLFNKVKSVAANRRGPPHGRVPMQRSREEAHRTGESEIVIGASGLRTGGWGRAER